MRDAGQVMVGCTVADMATAGVALAAGLAAAAVIVVRELRRDPSGRAEPPEDRLDG